MNNQPRATLGLLWTLVRTDFKVRYHGSLGGFAWALLKPLCMFFVLMSVFSFIFASDRTYALDLVVGLFLWDFFAEGTKSGLASLQSRSQLLTRTRCPAWAFVITSISNALVALAVFTIAIVAFLAWSGRVPGAAALAAFVAYCLTFAVMVMGFSLAASVLFLRFRDLNQVWDVAVQAGFFVAPVIYPIGVVPERLQLWLFAWPPTPIIEFSRAVLVDGAWPSARAHGLLAAEAALCLLIGALVFRAMRARVAELV